MIDPALVEDCPYGPGAFLLDDVLEVDPERSRVVAQMPVHAELPITKDQRAHPRFHPRHLSGGLMVHMTGVMGYVHAWYILGLRHAEGWVGYGVRIHDARFIALAEPGAPVTLEATATRVRKIREQMFIRYDFEMKQAGKLIYRSDQSAAWTKIPAEDPPSG